MGLLLKNALSNVNFFFLIIIILLYLFTQIIDLVKYFSSLQNPV